MISEYMFDLCVSLIQRIIDFCKQYAFSSKSEFHSYNTMALNSLSDLDLIVEILILFDQNRIFLVLNEIKYVLNLTSTILVFKRLDQFSCLFFVLFQIN